MKIQVTLNQLERIVAAARVAQGRNSDLSSTLTIERTAETDKHLGGDMVGVELKSKWAECNGESIYWNFDTLQA